MTPPAWIVAAAVMPLLVLPAQPGRPAQPARPQPAPGGWTWPLPPPHIVLAGFAPPAHDWLPGRRGVQLAATPGEAVLSAGPGVVGFAGLIGGVGVVTVRHGNGVETTYEPVAASVRAGDPVLAGQQVGVIRGRLAQCARVCLAWGLRRGASYLDPLALVGAVRVRLLPMLPVR